MIVRGSVCLAIRSIRSDRVKVSLRSVGYSLRMAYCISLGRFRIKMSLVIVKVAAWLISLTPENR